MMNYNYSEHDNDILTFGKYKGEKDISDEITKVLISNFERLDVKVLSLEDLERDIKKSTVHDVLREILTMKDIKRK